MLMTLKYMITIIKGASPNRSIIVHNLAPAKTTVRMAIMIKIRSTTIMGEHNHMIKQLMTVRCGSISNLSCCSKNYLGSLVLCI